MALKPPAPPLHQSPCGGDCESWARRTGLPGPGMGQELPVPATLLSTSSLNLAQPELGQWPIRPQYSNGQGQKAPREMRDSRSSADSPNSLPEVILHPTPGHAWGWQRQRRLPPGQAQGRGRRLTQCRKREALLCYFLSSRPQSQSSWLVPGHKVKLFTLVSLDLQWLIKTSDLFNMCRFSQVFCLLADCVFAFWSRILRILLYVSLRNPLCSLYLSFLCIVRGLWIRLRSISVFLYSLLQCFKALLFIEQFLLHLWEFSLQLFNL